MKETAHALYKDLKVYLTSLEHIEDIDLLTLKGHLLLESCLRRLLAVRLEAAEADIPRLAFHTLVRVVGAGANPERADPIEKQALLLNQMRNDIAHRLSPRNQSARMREFCAFSLTRRAWPSDPTAQRDVYRSAVRVLIMRVQLIGMLLNLAPAERASLHKRPRSGERQEVGQVAAMGNRL